MVGTQDGEAGTFTITLMMIISISGNDLVNGINKLQCNSGQESLGRQRKGNGQWEKEMGKRP